MNPADLVLLDWKDPQTCTPEALYCLLGAFEGVAGIFTLGNPYDTLKTILDTVVTENPVYPMLCVEDPLQAVLITLYREKPKLPKYWGGMFLDPRWPDEWVIRVLSRKV